MKNTLLLCFALISISLGAQTIERIDTVRTVTEETVQDTLMQLSSHTDSVRVELAPRIWKDTSRKGHYVQMGIGAGYGTMGMKARNTDLSSAGHAAGMGFVQYAYFFHENFGVSAGFGASSYGGNAVLNTDYTWRDVVDGDGETHYDHTMHVRDWNEQQRMWAVEMPFSLQYQQIYGPKGGMYASLGVAVGLSVAAKYHLTEGRIEHEGFYPWSNLTLDEKANPYFATDRVGEAPFTTKRHDMAIGFFPTTARCEIGWLYPVAPEWDIMVGAYARYTMNDLYPYNRTYNSHNFSFVHSDANHDLTFNEPVEYTGLTRCDAVAAIRPWQVGVHIGVQWHYRKTHTEAQERWDRFAVADTTYKIVDRVVKHEELHYDTVYSAVREIKRLMEKSIIWFDLNSSVPKLDPVDILDNIAAILVENPDLQIEVNGHTCTIGKQDYNLKLGARRADAVAKLLIKQGVKPEQITTHSYSSDKPFYSESHQLYLDRRVEIIPIEEPQE